MINVLVVEDHPATSLGLKFILTTHFDIGHIAIAENENQARVKVKDNVFHLAIVDINLPDSDAIGIVDMLKQRQSQCKILIYSYEQEATFAIWYKRYGANGFINKIEDQTILIAGIKRILSGQDFFLIETKDPEYSKKTKSGNIFKNLLSAREYVLCKLIVQGKSTAEICKGMSISASTVATIKSNIFTKLHIKNTVELVHLAYKNNFDTNENN